VREVLRLLWEVDSYRHPGIFRLLSSRRSRHAPARGKAFARFVDQNSTPTSKTARVWVVLVPPGPKASPGVVLFVPTWENSARAK
jgi:hypothetical protein